MPTTTFSSEVRFWMKVNKVTCIGPHCGCHKGIGHCWPWIAAINENGYGVVTINRKRYLAHRVAYELMISKIPTGLLLRHACNFPTCCRPEHLTPGTQQENMQDANLNRLHGNYLFNLSRPKRIQERYFTVPIDLRFWVKVNQKTCLGIQCGCHKKIGHCWPWIGGCTKWGYGQFRMLINGIFTHYSAHRLAYELTYGYILDGLLICHRCDNRHCCRPAHLSPGTHSDNTRDAYNKGRLISTLPTPKLTPEKAREIMNLKGILTGQEIADQFGVCRETVYAIHGKRIWKELWDVPLV